ncbi:MAG: FG-GAP-like repeat-containing protein, partial [Gemmataceae bacterium]|nr:FG-GAP-like repeat-containing protein [Gemmataceae bacterium]
AVSGAADGTAGVYAPAAGGPLATSAAATLRPFPGFAGSVRSATADVDGDGTPDTVLVTGPGTPVRVAVISGADHATVLVPPTAPFAGSEDFAGGGFVAAADLDGDGRAEWAVTPDDGGGPRVTVFGLAGGKPVVRADFLGIDDPGFRGGCRAALGDVDRDGVPELAVAAGFGGGPRVALFGGKTVLGGRPTRLVADFFAFPGPDAVTLRNGVYLAAGDVDGDGFSELIFGGGPGGAPRVFALSGKLVSAGDVIGAQAAPVSNFFVANNSADRGGVRVGAADADGDGRADLLAGSGAGSPARVRVYLGRNVTSAAEPGTVQDLAPFGGAALTDGVYVG